MVSPEHVTFVTVPTDLSISHEQFRMLEEGLEPMRRGDWGVWVVSEEQIELFCENEVGFRYRCERRGDRVHFVEVAINSQLLDTSDEAAALRSARLGAELVRLLCQRIESLRPSAGTGLRGEAPARGVGSKTA